MTVLLRRIIQAAVALLFVLALVAQAIAQAVTTGGIAGRALDEGGLALPGATITITSPTMIGSRSAVTDAQGTYRFTLLVPGTYRVSFSMSGFSTLNIDDVDVGAGNTMTINGTLKLGTISESVTVTSVVPTIDLEAATVGVNWGKRNMEQLPWGKSLPSLVGMIPGLYATQYDVGASTMGGTAAPPARTYGKTGANVAMYDGVVFDQFFGDFGSYEEVQVQAAAKGAEASSSGATMNFVIKSGGNAFHGSSQMAWQGHAVQSNNITQDLIDRGLPAVSGNQYTRYTDLKGDLGGPILLNKLWFYGAYTDSYAGQYITGFVSEESGQPEVFFTRLWGPTGRLTYQANRKMKFDFVTQWARKTQPYREADQWTPLEATRNQSYVGNVSSFKWNFFPSSSFTVDAAINRSGIWSEYSANTNEIRRQDITTGALSGAANHTKGLPLRWQYNGSASWFTAEYGRHHELKAGFLSFIDSNPSDTYGYPNQQLYRYRSVGGETDYFLHPDSVQVFDYPVSTNAVVYYNSAYVNDRISLTNQWTLNAGLRYDRYSSYLPEQGNPGTGPFAVENLYPETHDGFPVYSSWSPRVSTAYDLFGNGRVALKASYGRYTGASSGTTPHPGPSAATVNPAAAITRTYNNWDGTIPYVPDPANLVSTSGGGGSNRRLDIDNLKAATTDEYTLATELGGRSYVVRFNYVRKVDTNGTVVLDLAKPYDLWTEERSAIDPGPDNIVGTADDGVMYAWSLPPGSPALGTVDELTTRSDAKTTYDAFESTFSRHYSNGWSFLASATADVARPKNATPQNPNQAYYNWELDRWNYGIKINGSYDLPWGIGFASTFNAQSGEYYSRTAQMRNALNSTVTIVVDYNAGRYDWVKLWDNRFTKSFKLGNGKALQATLDIYNTLNASTVLTMITQTGPNYLKPGTAASSAATATAILPARIMRFGVKYTF